MKGEQIDEDLLVRKKDNANLEELECDSIEDAKRNLAKAKEDWSKWIENGKKQRELELLDLHSKEIDQEQLSRKQKRKIVRGIKKGLSRNRAFKYISTHIGKEERKGLKRLYAVNENNKIISTSVTKEEIE